MPDGKELKLSGKAESLQKQVGPRQTRWNVAPFPGPVHQLAPPGIPSQGVQDHVEHTFNASTQ